MELLALAKKYIAMLPKSGGGQSMPMPKLVIFNAITDKRDGIAIWNGRDIGSIVVKIQKRITGDEISLSRIVAHEICHAWAFWMVGIGEEKSPWQRGHSPMGGWYKAAQMINQHEGSEFVTEFSDESYVRVNDKLFWVYVERNQRGLWWAWFSRVTDNLARQLRYRISNAVISNITVTIIKSNDDRLLLANCKLPHVGRLTKMPENLTEKLENALRMYPIDEDSPHDIKTLVGQAKVAQLRHRWKAGFPTKFLQS